MNGPQTLYVNPGWLKWALDMNLGHANKNLFTISFILHLSNKISPNNRILLKGIFSPTLPNNPFASYFFINLQFILSGTTIRHKAYDKSLSFSLFLCNLQAFTFCLFSALQTI